MRGGWGEGGKWLVARETPEKIKDNAEALRAQSYAEEDGRGFTTEDTEGTEKRRRFHRRGATLLRRERSGYGGPAGLTETNTKWG